MVSKSGSSSASPLHQPLPPQAIIAVVALFAALIGLFAYRTFGPTARPKTFTVQEQKEWVAQLAKQSGGDFRKLTRPEQDRLNAISFGNGARYLRSMYAKRK